MRGMTEEQAYGEDTGKRRSGVSSMEMFEQLSDYACEELVFFQDDAAGLKAIIAIHDTTLGPALGGCRFWNYRSESEAVRDVLRLAKAMTLKASVAGLDLGGGKTVILGDPPRVPREPLFRALGRCVETLKGRYIIAPDVGTSVADMERIGRETRHVTGLPVEAGGGGDPSPMTALGVYQGMKACLQAAFGSHAVRGRTVVLQGLGSVGYHLAERLAAAGAKLVVADLDREKVAAAVRRFGARAVGSDDIYDQGGDIFSPCALGAVLNDETISRLQCPIVAGSANNQLKEDRHGETLDRRGILYAPDLVINAGGLFHVASETQGYDPEWVERAVSNLYHVEGQLLALAKAEGISTHRAAIRMAEERIARCKGLDNVSACR